MRVYRQTYRYAKLFQVEYEQRNQIRAEYGKQILKELSRELTREFCKGFSRSNLQNVRAFYLTYEKCQTPSGKLSCSHYCELLSISDANKEKVLSLAQKGIEISQPADIIRDPYVFEFLGVPENRPILENDLEKALVVQIEKFCWNWAAALCLSESSSALR